MVRDDGRIVTCAHVVCPSGEPVSRVRVVFRNGEVAERSVDGAVSVSTRHGPRRGEGGPGRRRPGGPAARRFGRLEVGDTVYSVGNGLDYDFSMTEGIVSALHRVLLGPNDAIIRDGIQTDAAVNVGDSGGPLLDARGSCRRRQRADRDARGECPRATSGWPSPCPSTRSGTSSASCGPPARSFGPGSVSRRSPSRRPPSSFWASSDRGILLVGVTPDGPAASAGLRGGDRVVSVPGSAGRTVTAGGDVITAMDGRPMASTDDLVDRVQALRPGDRLDVTYLRDGRVLQAVITVGSRPAQP